MRGRAGVLVCLGRRACLPMLYVRHWRLLMLDLGVLVVLGVFCLSVLVVLVALYLVVLVVLVMLYLGCAW